MNVCVHVVYLSLHVCLACSIHVSAHRTLEETHQVLDAYHCQASVPKPLP